MPFEIVGDITQVETIATGRRIRTSLGCAGSMVEGDGGSSKGLPWSACGVGPYARGAHWYEAHGIGRKEIKRKRYVDEIS
jgi:hypothetical protein